MRTQNRARRAYRRRSPAEIAQLVAEYQRSGLSPSAFCREKGMNRMTLQAYELRQQQKAVDTALEKDRPAKGEVERRRHRSRAEVYNLVAEYEASGLTRREFCNRSGVPLKTLARYLARYRRGKPEGSPPRWVPVEVVEPGSPSGELAVVLTSPRRIEVKRGFDGETLRRLLSELERG